MNKIPDNEVVWYETNVPDKTEAYQIDFVFHGAAPAEATHTRTPVPTFEWRRYAQRSPSPLSSRLR